jgi:hypothetical protein
MSDARPGAMRSFAGWVSAQPYRLILLTVAFVHLLAPVAAALLVLNALTRGPQAVAVTAMISIAGVLAIGLALGADMTDTLGLTAPVLIGGAVSGALLAWSRSLSFAFQGTTIGAITGTLIVLALVPEAGQIGEVLRAQVLTLLESGGAGAEQMARFEAISGNEFLRVLLISLIASLLAALMLGYWWFSLVQSSADFGADFRSLKLGRIAGIGLMALVIAGQLVDVQLIQNLAPMAVISFLFQGLAVMHARSYRGKWPRALVVVVYVMLVSPWTFIAITALSVVGLVDNFFDLRAPAKSQV